MGVNGMLLKKFKEKTNFSSFSFFLSLPFSLLFFWSVERGGERKCKEGGQRRESRGGRRRRWA